MRWPRFRWRFAVTSAVAHALLFLSAAVTSEEAVSTHQSAKRAVTLVYRDVAPPARGLAEHATGRAPSEPRASPSPRTPSTSRAARSASPPHSSAPPQRSVAREDQPFRESRAALLDLPPAAVERSPATEQRPRVSARVIEREEVDYYERARASLREAEHTLEPALASTPQQAVAPRAESSASAAFDLDHHERTAALDESRARAASALRPPPQPLAWELLSSPQLLPSTLGARPLELVTEFHPVSAAFFSPAFVLASVTPLAPELAPAPAPERSQEGARAQPREHEVTLFDPTRDRTVRVSVSARLVETPWPARLASHSVRGDSGEAAELELEIEGEVEGGAANPDQPRDVSEIAEKVARVLPLVYWDWERRGQLAGRTAVRFRLDDDGYARDVRLVRSSGNRALERESDAALQLASPFEFVPGWIELSLTFRG